MDTKPGYDFKAIINNVTRHVSPGEQEISLFISSLHCTEIKKKNFILRQGEICKEEYYINNGCIRSFFIDENGFEVILQFAVEDWWVSDIASFHEQKPSSMFIETLEDCELFSLSCQAKEALLLQAPIFERFFRLLVQRNLSALQERLFRTIAKSGEEKYLDFIRKYPAIPQRIPQHYIASYLGISPEFLSKIRRNIR